MATLEAVLHLANLLINSFHWFGSDVASKSNACAFILLNKNWLLIEIHFDTERVTPVVVLFRMSHLSKDTSKQLSVIRQHNTWKQHVVRSRMRSRMWVLNDLSAKHHQLPDMAQHSGRSRSWGGWKRSVHSQRSATRIRDEPSKFFTVTKEPLKQHTTLNALS